MPDMGFCRFSVPMYRATSINFGHARQVAVTAANNANRNFTFMLQCVVTDFFLITNQTHYLSKFILS